MQSVITLFLTHIFNSWDPFCFQAPRLRRLTSSLHLLSTLCLHCLLVIPVDSIVKSSLFAGASRVMKSNIFTETMQSMEGKYGGIFY